MSLLGSIANFFFPEAGPIPGLLVDYALSDGGGGGGGAAPAARQLVPTFSGIGGSALSWEEDASGNVWLPDDQASGGFDMGGMPTYDWQTPPFTPPSTAPGVFGQVLGSVLGAIIPSAEAALPAGVAGVIRAATGGTAMATALGTVGAGVAMVTRGMSGAVASALMALRQRLTGAVGSITPGALAGFGRKTWSSIQSWIRANPGTSAIGILTGLGLSVEQAAHFLAWGATSKKKGRSRGVSARDIRTSSRTIRKLTSFSRQLGALCSSAPRRAFGGKHRHRVTNSR